MPLIILSGSKKPNKLSIISSRKIEYFTMQALALGMNNLHKDHSKGSLINNNHSQAMVPPTEEPTIL